MLIPVSLSVVSRSVIVMIGVDLAGIGLPVGILVHRNRPFWLDTGGLVICVCCRKAYDNGGSVLPIAMKRKICAMYLRYFLRQA